MTNPTRGMYERLMSRFGPKSLILPSPLPPVEKPSATDAATNEAWERMDKSFREQMTNSFNISVMEPNEELENFTNLVAQRREQDRREQDRREQARAGVSFRAFQQSDVYDRQSTISNLLTNAGAGIPKILRKETGLVQYVRQIMYGETVNSSVHSHGLDGVNMANMMHGVVVGNQQSGLHAHAFNEPPWSIDTVYMILTDGVMPFGKVEFGVNEISMSIILRVVLDDASLIDEVRGTVIEVSEPMYNINPEHTMLSVVQPMVNKLKKAVQDVAVSVAGATQDYIMNRRKRLDALYEYYRSTPEFAAWVAEMSEHHSDVTISRNTVPFRNLSVYDFIPGDESAPGADKTYSTDNRGGIRTVDFRARFLGVMQGADTFVRIVVDDHVAGHMMLGGAIVRVEEEKEKEERKIQDRLNLTDAKKNLKPIDGVTITRHKNP